MTEERAPYNIEKAVPVYLSTGNFDEIVARAQVTFRLGNSWTIVSPVGRVSGTDMFIRYPKAAGCPIIVVPSESKKYDAVIRDKVSLKDGVRDVEGLLRDMEKLGATIIRNEEV